MNYDSPSALQVSRDVCCLHFPPHYCLLPMRLITTLFNAAYSSAAVMKKRPNFAITVKLIRSKLHDIGSNKTEIAVVSV